MASYCRIMASKKDAMSSGRQLHIAMIQNDCIIYLVAAITNVRQGGLGGCYLPSTDANTDMLDAFASSPPARISTTRSPAASTSSGKADLHLYLISMNLTGLHFALVVAY